MTPAVITQILFAIALIGIPVFYGLGFKKYRALIAFHVTMWGAWSGLAAIAVIFLWSDLLK